MKQNFNWTQRVPKYLMLLFALLMSMQTFSQKITMLSGYPKLSPAPLTIYDTSYVEVKFQVDQSFTGVRMTVTPQTGITRVATALTPIPAGGNTLALPSTTSATYTLGSIGTTDIVAFRFPVTSATCAAADGLKVTLVFDKGAGSPIQVVDGFSVSHADGKVDLAFTFQKPTINWNIPTATKTVAAKNVNTSYSINLNAATGVLNDFKLTFTVPRAAGIKNLKLAGYTIPAANITKVAATGAAAPDTVYTVVFDKALLTAALPATQGKLTSTVVALTLDAWSRTDCNTKKIILNGWFPASANASASTPNVTPSGACGTIDGSPTLTMQMTEAVGIPLINYQTATWVTANKDICYDKTTPNFVQTIFKNAGSADAYNNIFQLSAIYSHNHNLSVSACDTTNIYYRIGNGPEVRVTGAQQTVTAKLNSNGRSVMPAYADLPGIVIFTVPKIPKDSTITFRTATLNGQFYDDTKTSEGRLNTYHAINHVGVLSVEDECGGNGGFANRTSPFATNGPTLTVKAEALTVRGEQTGIVSFSGVRAGSDEMGTTNGMPRSIEVFVQLPLWMRLHADSLTKGTAMQWLNPDKSAVWPSTWPEKIKNYGNGKYSIKLSSVDNTAGKYDDGFFRLCYQADACATITTDLSDEIVYWIDYHTYENNTTATACRPVFGKIGLMKQNATCLCKEDGFVIEDYHWHRTTKGYTDRNNDGIPDDGNKASDDDIDHNTYLKQDSGYVVWKGRVAAAGATTSFQRLYALLTSSGNLKFASLASPTSNRVVFLPEKAVLYIDGIAQPAQNLSIERPSELQLYAAYQGNLNAGDRVEIRLPFYVRLGLDVANGNFNDVAGECFVSNSVSANPFSSPADRHGEDLYKKQISVYNQYPITSMVRMTFPDNNTIQEVGLNAYNYYYFYKPWFSNEYRPHKMENAYIVLPLGYRLNDLNVRTEVLYYAPDGNTTLQGVGNSLARQSNDTVYFDMHSFLDYTNNGAVTSPAVGKYRVPDDRLYLRFFPKIKSTKGAVVGVSFIPNGVAGRDLLNGAEDTFSSDSREIVYTGQSTKLLLNGANTATLQATTAKMSLPVLLVGNPGVSTLHNVWLYVEGNVKNISHNAVLGTGFEGRWIKVATSLAGDADITGPLNFTYIGSAGCTDVVKIHTVTGYENSSWTPNTAVAWTGTDEDHMGAIRALNIIVPPTSVGGSLKVTNTNVAVPDGFIKFQTVQQLEARLDNFGSAGMLRGKMAITVPAGQKYVAGSAKITYPATATQAPVATAYNTYLVSLLSNAGTLGTARTFDFDFAAAMGDPTAMIDGTGVDANKEAILHLNFSPECGTTLTGLRYEGTLSGTSACGVEAANTGKKVYSEYQYPDLFNAYTFALTNSFSDNRSVVANIDTLLNINVSLAKASGSMANIMPTDSLELKMHPAFNIISAAYAGPTGSNVFKMGSNKVVGGERVVRMTIPAAYLDANMLTPVNYTIKVSYNQAQYPIAEGDQQTISTGVVSSLRFDATCPIQEAYLISKDTAVGVAKFEPYPGKFCPTNEVTATIANTALNSDYTFKWYGDAAKTQALGTGGSITFLASKKAKDTLFVEAVKKDGNKSIGIIRYPYTTHDSITTAFTSDSVCLGAATTFADKTKVGTANATTTNVTSWAWYEDDELLSNNQNPKHTFATAGNHQIKLVVTGKNGCMDSITKTVYVKPRATVSFTNLPVSVCANNDVTFNGNGTTVSGGTIASYVWKYGDGATGTGSTSTHAYAAGGSYTAKLLATTNLGCTDSISKTITIDASPVVTLSNTLNETCSGNNVEFTTTSGLSYTWETAGATVVAGATSTNNTATLKWATAGSKKVKVTGKNANNCTASDSVTIVITTTPAATITSTATGDKSCVSEEITFTTQSGMSGYTWTTGGGTIVSGGGPTDATVTLLWATAGTKTVSVNYTSGTCAGSTPGSKQITINTLPTVTLNSDKTSACVNDNIVFTTQSGMSGYVWTVDGGTIVSGGTSTSNTATVKWTGSGSKAVTVNYKNANGCMAATPTSKVVTINNLPVPTLNASLSTACANTDITFTTENGKSSYTWTTDGATITSGASSTTATSVLKWATSGTKTVTVTYSDANGCRAATVADFEVTIKEIPTVTIPGNDAVCPGIMKDYTLTGTGTSYNANSAFPAIVSASASGSTLSVMGSNTTAGTLSSLITVTPVKDGCNGTPKTFTITVNPNLAPTVSIVSNPSIPTVCTGTNITFTATPVNGGTTPVYQWKKNGSNTGTNSTTFSSTTLNNGDVISCVVTSNATCASPSTATSNNIAVTVNSELTPLVSISTPSTSVCTGSSVTFTATPTNGGTTPTYVWKKNGTTIGGATAATYTVSTLSNNDKITCEMVSNASCANTTPVTSNEITMTVTASAPAGITIAATGGTTVCANTTVVFTATPANGGANPTYQWMKGGVNISGATSSTYSYKPDNNDVISCSMISNSACASPATATSTNLTMTVNPTLVPSVSIISDKGTSVCAGTTVTYTATPNNGGTNPTYQWKKGGINVSTGATYSYEPVNGDVITCELTSNANCLSTPTVTSNSINMTVNPVLVPSISISSNPLATSICAGISVTFTATATNTGTSPIYQWKKNGNNVGTNSINYTDNALADGDVITCVLTSNAICGNPTTITSTSITFTVTPLVTPTISVSADKTTVCSGASVTFTATATNPGASPIYQWKKNGTNVGGNATTFTYSPANNDVVTCEITSSATCANPVKVEATSILMTVTNSVTPSVSIVSNQGITICTGTDVTFTATPINGGTTPVYQWKKNGTNVGINSATYSDNALVSNDVIACELTSSDGCANPKKIGSNNLTMAVTTTVTPTITISANPGTTVCNGTFVTYTATVTNGGIAPTYQWKVNGSNAGTGATYSYIPTNNDQVTCQIVSNASCANSTPVNSNTLTMTVSNNVVPTISVASNQGTTVCANTSVTYTTTITNGGMTPTYQWKKNGVNVGTGTTTYTVIPVNGDVITCELTSNATCANPVTVTAIPVEMVVNSTIVPSVSIVSDQGNTVCAGTEVTYTATPTNGGSTPTYKWKVNGSVMAGETVESYVFTPTNGNAIVCEMTSNAGCASPATVTSNTITMATTTNLVPAVSIASDKGTTVCANTTVTYTATPTNGGSTPTYQWKVNGTNAGLNGNANTYSYIPVDGDVVSCVMTSSATCVSTSTATATGINMAVTPLVTPTISVVSNQGNTVCTNTSVTYTATISNGGTTPSYQWKKNGIDVGTSNSTYIYTPINGDVITCALTSNIACASTTVVSASPVEMVVTSSVIPTVSIATNQGNTVCAGTEITCTATPTNGGSTPTYKWKVNGSVMAGETGESYTFTPTNGNTIVCEMTSNAGCASPATVTSNTITIATTTNLVPAVSIASDKGVTVCANTTVTYTATPTNGGSTPTYQWKVNGTDAGLNGNANTYSYIPVDGDVISCVMTSSVICTSTPTATSNNVTMSVNANVVPTITVTPDQGNTVCANTSVTYTAIITNGGTTPAYQWKKNGTNVGGNSTTFTYIPVNNDIITCEVTSNATCVNPEKVEATGILMTVSPMVTPSINISSNIGNNVCTGTSVTFTANTANEGTTPSYQWKVNGVNAGTNTTTYSYVPVNGDVVSCVLTSSEVCVSNNIAISNSITMSVTVPTVNVLSNTIVCGGTTTTIFLSGTADSYVAISDKQSVVTAVATNGNQLILTALSSVVNLDSAQISITPKLGTCAGMTQNFTVVVNPMPVMSIESLVEVCSGESHAILQAKAVNVQQGVDIEYSIIFNEDARRAGFTNITYTLLNDTIIKINRPTFLPAGYYGGVLRVRSTNGCESTTYYPFDIQMLDPVKIIEQPKSATICDGDGLLLSVSATGKNLTYQWYKDGQAIAGATQPEYSKNSIASDDYGIYYVEVSGRCGMIKSTTSKIKGNIVKIGKKWDDVLFVYGADDKGNSYGVVSYQWYKENSQGEMMPIQDKADVQSYLDPKGINGTYAVKVTYVDGTTLMSCPINLTSVAKASFKVYPNPAVKNEKITILLETGVEDNTGSLEIYDVRGLRVLNTIITEQSTEIHLDVPTGVYVLYVTDSRGNKYVEKIKVQ